MGYDSLDPNSKLDRLREMRVRPGRDLTVGSLVEGFARSAQKRHKATGGVAGALDEALPESLRGRMVLEGMRAGVAIIKVDDSSARFELDRWLRAGGLDEIRRISRTTVRRVKLV